MPYHIEYKEGQKLGPHKVVYLRDCDWKGKERKAKFLCNCGKEFVTTISKIKNGHTRSCGCYHRSQQIKSATKHGLRYSRAYSVYMGMMARCYNKKEKGYKNYGGRGIIICDRWLGEGGFVKFLSDMGEPKDKDSIERVNVNGNYSPENCVWAKDIQQARNKRKYSNNTSGRTGVYVDKIINGSPYYKATISYAGKSHTLIMTFDFELAEFCRQEAELHYYGFIKE